jgi:SAM-dependent methyltransferase
MVLERIWKPLQVLREIRQVLKEDGIVVISFLIPGAKVFAIIRRSGHTQKKERGSFFNVVGVQERLFK